MGNIMFHRSINTHQVGCLESIVHTPDTWQPKTLSMNTRGSKMLDTELENADSNTRCLPEFSIATFEPSVSFPNYQDCLASSDEPTYLGETWSTDRIRVFFLNKRYLPRVAPTTVPWLPTAVPLARHLHKRNNSIKPNMELITIPTIAQVDRPLLIGLE